MKNHDPFLRELMQDKEFFEEYFQNHYRDEIGIQMIQLRAKRGLTQSQLAEKAGTTQTVVSRLENATVKPSLETVRKLAHALQAILEINLIPQEEIIAENAMSTLIDYSPELSERLINFSKQNDPKVSPVQTSTRWFRIEPHADNICIVEG